MDLKIKDVAELLNVSEITVRRWLSEGKIPAYRLNRQYRFSRIEIEDWMMSRKLGQFKGPEDKEESSTFQKDDEKSSRSILGSQQFSLYRAIHKGGVYSHIQGKTKEEIIRASSKIIAQKSYTILS